MTNDLDNKTRTRSDLEAEVERFRSWAAMWPPPRSNGWEQSYQDWPLLTRKVCDYLDSHSHNEVKKEDADRILYLLARDDETGWIQSELKIRPFHLLLLAEVALSSAERNARWQMADALSAIPKGNKKAESLLALYLNDQDEYVSRRALIALGKRASPTVELVAQQFWESGNEHRQMALLQALKDTGSSSFSTYYNLALQDGREHLSVLARRLMSDG